jgi:hypothetical protein
MNLADDLLKFVGNIIIGVICQKTDRPPQASEL